MKFLKENINISAECLYFLFLGNQGQLFKKRKIYFYYRNNSIFS